MQMWLTIFYVGFRVFTVVASVEKRINRSMAGKHTWMHTKEYTAMFANIVSVDFTASATYRVI